MVGGCPFTVAQRKELERQAMIFKYMTASLPVPHKLLLPLTTGSRCNDSSSFSSMFILTDPETGRCRRTDGKKWRCTRDVAPDQKYCDRHLHRGRPRSRKPGSGKPLEPQLLASSSSSSSLFQPYSCQNYQDNSSSSFLFQSPPSPFHITTRNGDFQSQGELQISDMVPANFPEEQRPQQWLPEKPIGTRDFIDAWAHEVEKDVRESRLLTDLTLSMAMVGGDAIDQQMYRVEATMMDDYYGPQRVWEERSTGRDPKSWVVASGGPLAEVLRLSCVDSASVED